MGTGGRTTGNGYASDGVRQRFTGYEQDDEIKLDYAQARYYASTQGRFASVDPLQASAHAGDPQSWNRYAYAGNNPLKFVDPSGMNYFVGGGVSDPFITEYRVDGFDMGLEGTTSQLTGETMVGLSPQWEDVNPNSGGEIQQDPGSVVSSNGTCSIQLSWGDKLTASPPYVDGPDHLKLGAYVGEAYGITAYEFRFEVSGWVSSGGIGSVGTPKQKHYQDLGTGGAWTG